MLLRLADSTYKFIFTNVGCQGGISDGGIFSNTELYNRLISYKLHLPDPMELQGSRNTAWNLTGESTNHFLQHLMKPYTKNELDNSKRIFNVQVIKVSSNCSTIPNN